MANKYMHTLHGKLAFFGGDQIRFAHQGVKLSALLVDSLSVIRNQQEASRRWRKEQGLTPRPCEGGYLQVEDE